MKTIPTHYKVYGYSIIANEKMQDKSLLILNYTNNVSGYENQHIWSKSKLMKPKNCIITGELMPVGTMVYRPITNCENRGHRMKATELEKYL